MQPRRPQGHFGAASLDDHVADLAGGAAAEPGLAVEDQPAADAGSPPDAEHGLVGLAGAEVELALDRDLDVVADLHRRRRASFESVSASGKRAVPAGQVLALETTPVFSSASPGEPTPSRPAPGLDAGLLGGLAHRAGDRGRPRPAGRPRSGVGRRASPSTWLRALTTTVWILVPPRSTPPRQRLIAAGLTLGHIYGRDERCGPDSPNRCSARGRGCSCWPCSSPCGSCSRRRTGSCCSRPCRSRCSG